MLMIDVWHPQRNLAKHIASLSSLTVGERIAMWTLETSNSEDYVSILIISFLLSFQQFCSIDRHIFFSIYYPTLRLLSYNVQQIYPQFVFYRNVDDRNNLAMQSCVFIPTLTFIKRRFKCIDFSVLLNCWNAFGICRYLIEAGEGGGQHIAKR